eukprot:gb/GFBE01064582.1/.p1 GENE.gb/GFBE01064582.1/~~gb/GFBE01064582.1/.p1  ORF type:complete len:559 (+),score=141.50 gb/GFBE01064582.1/:1-1677(+)
MAASLPRFLLLVLPALAAKAPVEVPSAGQEALTLVKEDPEGVEVKVSVDGAEVKEEDSKPKFGPVLQDENKLDEFGFGKYSSDVLDWNDLRSTILGRECSMEEANSVCGELVCRKGFCSYCEDTEECPSLHSCLPTKAGKTACKPRTQKAWESAYGDRSETMCTALILVSAALAAAAGTGGGSIFVPVLISFSYLQESAVVALSQFMIFVGSIVNLSVFVARRHADFPELPVIDYDCVVVLIPSLCAGVTLGVLVNRTAPSWLLLALLCSTLCLALWRTAAKGIKQLRQEQSMLMQRQTSPEAAPSEGAPAATSYGEALAELVSAKSEQILGIVVVWLLMLGSSLHGLSYCSFSYAVFLGVMITLLAIIAKVMTWRFQATSYLNPIDWLNGGKDRHPMTFPLVAFCTGFLGAMLGLGGGILLSPVFLEVGMHSEAVQATTAVFVFLSSSIATIQYFMMGQIVWHYAIWYGGVTVLATYLGQTACEVFIRKRKRYSFITLAVSAVLMFSLICLSIVGTNTVMKDYEMGRSAWFSTEQICDGGRGTIIMGNVASIRQPHL